MVLNIAIKGLVGIFVTYIAFFITSPIVYTLRYESGMFDNVDGTLLAATDLIYSNWLLMPFLIAGLIIFWWYSAANRKRQEEFA